jgi:hypothetical protein
MKLSPAPASNCCCCSRLPAPGSQLQAPSYLRIKCVHDLHPVFKYMRDTAGAARSHASQNKIDAHKY